MDKDITSSLKIKSRDDLKKIIKFLDDNGFGYLSEHELHEKKIAHIISNANTFNIKYDDKLKSNLYKLTNYADIEKEAKQFFTKFNVTDKIKEYIKIFSIQSDASCSTPWTRPDTKDVIAWVEFKKKYNLKDEFNPSTRIYYYNLDKNYIKVSFGSYKTYEFKHLYKLIFNEDCVDFSDKKYGGWINLGKIEIKFFQNGYANLKGDLKKLKEYYYQYIKTKIYNDSHIIKYNDKEEILKGKRND